MLAFMLMQGILMNTILATFAKAKKEVQDLQVNLLFGLSGPMEGHRKDWLHLKWSTGVAQNGHLKGRCENGTHDCDATGKCVMK